MIFEVYSMKHVLFSIIFQKKATNFNSGAKKPYYFLPVKDSSATILEIVKKAFPRNPKNKFKFFKTGLYSMNIRKLDLKNYF